MITDVLQKAVSKKKSITKTNTVTPPKTNTTLKTAGTHNSFLQNKICFFNQQEQQNKHLHLPQEESTNLRIRSSIRSSNYNSKKTKTFIFQEESNHLQKQSVSSPKKSQLTPSLFPQEVGSISFQKLVGLVYERNSLDNPIPKK